MRYVCVHQRNGSLKASEIKMEDAISWYREFQQCANNILSRIRQLSPRDEVILSRTACLGTGVQSLLNWGRSINHQKNRADLILNRKKIVTIPEVSRLLLRKDVLSLIYAQRQDIFSYRRVSSVVFDSFSELVDREFITRDGKRFYAVNGDVNKELLVHEGGICGDLLDLSNIFEIYEELFSKIHERYQCKIFFLNFPTKFEQRQLYQERANIIAVAGRKLMKHKDYFFNVEVPSDMITQGNDCFPYHFSEKTYLTYAECVQEIKRTGATSTLK